MCHIHAQLRRLDESDIPLLLRGETGTGKEVTARAIHRLSGRKGPIMCARLSTLPPQRVESLLFGHRRGALPEAEDDQPGLFEEADGGTLLMDDLGELSPEVQAKLLRAIDERQVNRVGEDAPRSFDVRVICTTLHDVHAMVQSERFRADLYARLAGFEVELPPLRDRRADLGLLTRFLMRAQGGDTVKIATRAFRRLLAHRWPFNVRELAQTLATATILAGEEGEITSEIIEEILDRRRDIPQTPSRVQELRSELIAQMVEHGGNTAAVAQAMACGTEEIQRWIERFDLTADTFKH
jgi:DNA-binding NtrC family response regulator